MLYLAAQIWFHLLLAFALGAVVLWWWLQGRNSETGLGAETDQALQTSLDETAALLRVAEANLAQAREEAKTKTDELEHRRGQWAEASAAFKAEIAALKQERDAVPPPRDQPNEDGPNRAKAQNVEPRLPEELLIDPASAARSRDDLKKIKGIGRVLEGLLNKMDIYTFRDIAAWGDDDIDRVQAKLPRFPGRIRRDGWVDQAAALDSPPSGRDPSSRRS